MKLYFTVLTDDNPIISPDNLKIAIQADIVLSSKSGWDVFDGETDCWGNANEMLPAIIEYLQKRLG